MQKMLSGVEMATTLMAVGYELSLLMEEEGHHLQVIAEAVMAAVVVVEGVMAFLGILIIELSFEVFHLLLLGRI